MQLYNLGDQTKWKINMQTKLKNKEYNTNDIE